MNLELYLLYCVTFSTAQLHYVCNRKCNSKVGPFYSTNDNTNCKFIEDECELKYTICDAQQYKNGDF